MAQTGGNADDLIVPDSTAYLALSTRGSIVVSPCKGFYHRDLPHIFEMAFRSGVEPEVELLR